MNRNNTFISFLFLIRLNNVIISVIALIVSMNIASNILNIRNTLIAVLSVIFLTSGGNIINDYFDIETDRINKPQRPLISHKYNLVFIYFLSIFFLLIGTLITLFISSEAFIIALLSGILLYLYSRFFKRMPIIGNFVVSLLSGLLFIYGALVAENIRMGVFPAIFAFFMTFGREITKDIEDIEGDELSGMKTLPIIIGKDKAFLIAVINYIFLIALTFVPYFYGIYNKWYFIIVVFGVDLILLVLLLMFYIFNDIKTMRIVNDYLKYDMIIGLIAIVIGVK